MRSDKYSKAVLTVIAVMLSLLACKTLINPDTAASAQPALGGTFSFSGASGVIEFFDSGNGDLWRYSPAYNEVAVGHHSSKWQYLGRVTKLGEPLAGAPQ